MWRHSVGEGDPQLCLRGGPLTRKSKDTSRGENLQFSLYSATKPGWDIQRPRGASGAWREHEPLGFDPAAGEFCPLKARVAQTAGGPLRAGQ